MLLLSLKFKGHCNKLIQQCMASSAYAIMHVFVENEWYILRVEFYYEICVFLNNKSQCI